MKNRYYYGFFFLFIQVVAIIFNYLDRYNYYFWFCDFVPILLSIAFFIKNEDMVKGLINFGLIPQIVFLIDFIYLTNTGNSVLAINLNYQNFTSLTVLSTILVHLSTIFALLFTFRIKPTKKTMSYSLVTMFLIYFMTLIFTSPQEHVNWVYSAGVTLSISIPHLVWLWPLIVTLFAILPTQGIQYWFYKLSKK